MISRHSPVEEWMRDPRWAEPFEAAMLQIGMSRGRVTASSALYLHQIVVLGQGAALTPLMMSLLADIDRAQGALRPSARDLCGLFLARPPTTDSSRAAAISKRLQLTEEQDLGRVTVTSRGKNLTSGGKGKDRIVFEAYCVSRGWENVHERVLSPEYLSMLKGQGYSMVRARRGRRDVVELSLSVYGSR